MHARRNEWTKEADTTQENGPINTQTCTDFWVHKKVDQMEGTLDPG